MKALSFGRALVSAMCLFVAATAASPVHAQLRSPAHKDVAYNEDHVVQKLDVYLAKSDKPVPAMVFIHGGGWRAGSKNRVPAWLIAAVRAGRFSVISVEYRFTNVAPHPAQVNDCLRAIQFVRHNAARWNIDPKRIGVTGGSAGGHLSLWVALHDDVAEPQSKDSTERHSSRVACAVSFAGPTDWSLLGEIEHNHPAYRQLLGYEPGTPADQMDTGKKKDVSPISFVSKDDPPIMQVHGDRDVTVPIEHARKMDKQLRSVGVKSELVVIKGGNHGVAGAGPLVAKRADAFVREHLRETASADASHRLGELITIPAGPFKMGNNGSEPFSPVAELPQHTVDVEAFEIGKYEVTRGEYRRFIEDGGYEKPGYWPPEGWKWNQRVGRKEPAQWAAQQEWVGHGYGPHRFTQTDKHPVVGVTYYEAEAYCKWAGGRLPTEAEWEKAARWAGAQAYVFPWGDAWDAEKCNNLLDSNPAGGGIKRLQSAPVGSYPAGASPYGCLDIVGNAYEWVADPYKPYPGAAQSESFFPGVRHFPRGGCWDDGPMNNRCAYRGWSLPPDRSGPNPTKDCDFIGLRVAR